MTAKNSRPTVTPTAHKNLDLAKNTPAAGPASDPARERPGFELSATQIIAGTAAAMTAALLGSRLGVAGTILGAALGSVISIVAGAIYSHSIASARHRVRALTRRDHPAARLLIGLPAAPVSATDMPATRALPIVTEPLRPTRASRPRHPSPRRPFRGVLVGTVAGAVVFIAALVVVTGIETVKGTPLSGGGAGGLSVLGGDPVGDPDPASVPAPAGTMAATTPAADRDRPTGPESISDAPKTAAPETATSGTAASDTAGSDTAGPGTAGQRSSSTPTSPTSPTRPGASTSPATSASAEPTTTTAPATSAPASSSVSSPSAGSSSPTGSSPATTPSATTSRSTTGLRSTTGQVPN